MESMASEVTKCLSSASFGGKPLFSHRGIQPDHFLFDDEDNLKEFLKLTEEQKMLYSKGNYKVNSNNDLLTSLSITWNLSMDFEGDYYEDYKMLNNVVELHGRISTLFAYTLLPLYKVSVLR